MSIHVIGVVALVLVFVIGTLRTQFNIGALALIASFFIGTLVAHESVTGCCASATCSSCSSA